MEEKGAGIPVLVGARRRQRARRRPGQLGVRRRRPATDGLAPVM